MNTRRECLSLFATAAMGAPAALTAPAGRFIICAFSKHFQWTGIGEAARVCADFGYEGMDITLRPGATLNRRASSRTCPRPSRP